MLTEQKIRTFVGEQNFLKGQQGVRDGAIVNPEQQAMALKACCYGSLPEPFRVQVTFDGSGITASLCSCSGGTPAYGNCGCEHAAALLLAWNELPEAFTQIDDIDTILERQSKAQLITLIKQLLQKQLEVEWQLTMPPLPGHKSVPIDTEEYRRQVDAAFRHAGREWDAVYGISSDLYSITEHCRSLRSTAGLYQRRSDLRSGGGTEHSAITSPIMMRMGRWVALFKIVSRVWALAWRANEKMRSSASGF